MAKIELTQKQGLRKKDERYLMDDADDHDGSEEISDEDE